MDLFTSVRLLFLLSVIGCCAGQDALPEGPVDAVLGRCVTLKTLLENQTFVVIIWSFNDGTEEVNVAIWRAGGLKPNDPYEGRVLIDPTNGQLTISSLKSEDSGDYSVAAVTSEDTLTGEIMVRVLEPVSDVVIKSNVTEAIEHNDTVVLTCSAKGSFLKFTWLNGTAPITGDGKRITVKDENSSSVLTIQAVLRSDLVGPIFCSVANSQETEKSAPFNLTVHFPNISTTATPELTKQHTDDAWLVVVCVVVTVVLSVGYLLRFGAWMKNRNICRTVAQQNGTDSTPEDSTYQSLNPASMDQDQLYSSLTLKRDMENAV